jgi:hypothetical protein
LVTTLASATVALGICVTAPGSSLLALVARCSPSSGNTERLPFADAEEMALSVPVAGFVMDLSFISRTR